MSEKILVKSLKKNKTKTSECSEFCFCQNLKKSREIAENEQKSSRNYFFCQKLNKSREIAENKHTTSKYLIVKSNFMNLTGIFLKRDFDFDEKKLFKGNLRVDRVDFFRLIR